MLWLIGVIGVFGAFMTVLPLVYFFVGLENLLIFGLPQLVIFLIWLAYLRGRRKPIESASTGGEQRREADRAASYVGDVALIVFAVLAVWLCADFTWIFLLAIR
jgi:hypothetical protein